MGRLSCSRCYPSPGRREIERRREKERESFSWDVVTKKDLHLVSTMIMRKLSLLHSR